MIGLRGSGFGLRGAFPSHRLPSATKPEARSPKPNPVLIGLLALASCVPDLDQRTSIVDRPIVLAVVAEPAEAAPDKTVAYHALVATPDGEAASPMLAWAYCTQPKPPTEDNAVSSACLDDPGVPLAGTGADATGTIPNDACARFGPNPPGAGFRPRDPDPTGGYYQPVRVTGDGLVSFGLDRIHCDLANAPPEIVAQYRLRYHDNQNPPPPTWDVPATARAGATIALHVSWPAAAAEPYVSYDVSTVSLVDRREAMRVSFYATAGRFDTDAAGVAEDDPATAVDDAWTAPATPGPVTIWAVLRDSRGGVSIARTIVQVQ
jgi:hypothetical protein